MQGRISATKCKGEKHSTQKWEGQWLIEMMEVKERMITQKLNKKQNKT